MIPNSVLLFWSGVATATGFTTCAAMFCVPVKWTNWHIALMVLCIFFGWTIFGYAAAQGFWLDRFVDFSR